MAKPCLTSEHALALLSFTSDLLDWYLLIKPSPIGSLVAIVLAVVIAWLEARKKD
jgi:hypothetical protein